MTDVKTANDTFYANMEAAQVYLNRVRSAAIGDWLPYSPLDVEAKVYVELGEGEAESDTNNTRPLADFIAELQELAAVAPEGADVVIDLGARPGGDDYATGTYEVGYFRDPTEEERAEREETNRKIAERDAKKVEQAAAKEREEFERLKAKFGE